MVASIGAFLLGAKGNEAGGDESSDFQYWQRGFRNMK
jgi:hypothetical protein